MCLTLYGPFAMASVGDAGFMIEICADDVVTAVFIGADGGPVAQDHDCAECLTCGHAAVFVVPATGGAAALAGLLASDAPRFSVQATDLKTRNMRPAPRGSPALHDFTLFPPDLIGFQGAANGDQTRSDLRFFLKDATA